MLSFQWSMSEHKQTVLSDIIRIFIDMTEQQKKGVGGKQKSTFVAIGQFLQVLWGVVLWE